MCNNDIFKIDTLLNLLNNKSPCFIYCDDLLQAEKLTSYIKDKYSTKVVNLNFNIAIEVTFLKDLKTYLLRFLEEWETFYNRNIVDKDTLYIITGINQLYKNEILTHAKNCNIDYYLTWYFSYPIQLPIFSLSNTFNLGATYTYSKDFDSQKNIIEVFEEVIASIIIYNITS